MKQIDDKTLNFIVLMAYNGETDFPEFNKLKKAIKKLPPKERMIANAHYLRGEKIVTIADFYNYSERQVYRILASAKELMRGSEINDRA